MQSTLAHMLRDNKQTMTSKRQPINIPTSQHQSPSRPSVPNFQVQGQRAQPAVRSRHSTGYRGGVIISSSTEELQDYVLMEQKELHSPVAVGLGHCIDKKDGANNTEGSHSGSDVHIISKEVQVAGQLNSVKGTTSQTQSDHGEEGVDEAKGAPAETNRTSEQLLSGEQLLNFAEKSLDVIKQNDIQNLTHSTVLVSNQNGPQDRENAETVVNEAQTTHRGEGSAVGDPAAPASVSPPPGRDQKPPESTREPIKLKQQVINLEDADSRVTFGNYYAMSRRSRRSTLRQTPINGKKPIHIQVNSMDREQPNYQEKHTNEALSDDPASKSNSQVETHLGQETPYMPRTRGEMLPVIEDSSQTKYREIKPKEFTNHHLAKCNNMKIITRARKSPAVAHKRMDLYDIKHIEEIADYVLASSRIEPADPTARNEDMKHLNSGDSFILQTSDRRNLSNQFSTKKHLKQVRKRALDNNNDLSQQQISSEIRLMLQDHSAARPNERQRKLKVAAESGDLVLSSQKIVLQQQGRIKKQARAQRSHHNLKEPAGFVRAELAPLRLGTDGSIDQEPQTAAFDDRHQLALQQCSTAFDEAKTLKAHKQQTSTTSPLLTQSMIGMHAVVQQPDDSVSSEAAVVNSAEAGRKRTGPNIQRGNLNVNEAKKTRLALVQMTTTEEYEELADRFQDALLQGTDSKDQHTFSSRPGSRFGASFLHKTKKVNSKRKLKTGSDLNAQLSHWPRDEDKSRYFLSEVTDADFRLNAKIIDHQKEAKIKRTVVEAVKSPNPHHVRHQLHIDHKGGYKAESQSSAVKDQTSQSAFPLISSQYQVKEAQPFPQSSESKAADSTEPKPTEHLSPQVLQAQAKIYRHTFSPKQLKPGPNDQDFKSGPSTKGRKSLLNSAAESLIGEVVGEGINLKNETQNKAALVQREARGSADRQEQVDMPASGQKQRIVVAPSSQVDALSSESVYHPQANKELPAEEAAAAKKPDDQLAPYSAGSSSQRNDDISMRQYLRATKSKMRQSHHSTFARPNGAQPADNAMRLVSEETPNQDHNSTPNESATARPGHFSPAAPEAAGQQLPGGLRYSHEDRMRQPDFESSQTSEEVTGKAAGRGPRQRQTEMAILSSAAAPKLRAPSHMKIQTHAHSHMDIQPIAAMPLTTSHTRSTKLTSLAEYPVAPQFSYSRQNVDQVRNLSPKSKLQDPTVRKQQGRYQDIIDYPRHIRFSSAFESVSKIQNDMRRQRIFHREFAPAFCSDKNQVILEGVYIPNKSILKQNAEMYVNEFIRAKGNLKTEPVVKPKSELIKVYGKPTLKAESFVKRARPVLQGPDGKELTADEIVKKKLAYKNMLNYTRNLLIEHRSQPGDEVELKIKVERQQEVDDMVAKKENPATGSAKMNFLAQKRTINEKLDDGFELDIPDSTQWHPSQREDVDFVNKINTTSMEAMVYAFKKLVKPREQGGSNVASRLYDDSIKLPGDTTTESNYFESFSRSRDRAALDLGPENRSNRHLDDSHRIQRSLPYSQAKLQSKKLVPHSLSSRSMMQSPKSYRRAKNQDFQRTAAELAVPPPQPAQEAGLSRATPHVSRIEGFNESCNLDEQGPTARNEALITVSPSDPAGSTQA